MTINKSKLKSILWILVAITLAKIIYDTPRLERIQFTVMFGMLGLGVLIMWMLAKDR